MKKDCLIRVISSAFVWAACLLPAGAPAELTLASPFTDHAVLQRDMPVPVWGTADAGATVTVEFAGQVKEAVADSSNHWKIMLDAMPASSKPRKMKVSSSIGNQPASEAQIISQGEIANKVSGSLAIVDVVVGEVWICSGQSNMQMSHRFAPDVEALLPFAKNIRTFEVKRTAAFTEQDRCEGEWAEEPPDSAVALAFAFFLEHSADVPVGIILTAWGSSSIEAWMPRDMTSSVPHFKTIMEEFDADTETRDRIAGILDGPRPWPKPDDIFLRRQPNILYNAMMSPLAPYACRGLVWYQGERNTQSMFGMVEEPWYSRNSGMLKYGDTLKQWISRYRQEWNNPDMHFMVVMLPGYHRNPLSTGPQLGAEHPAVHSWAWMRESQLKALELPHVSVANTIDLGELDNVHPKDKLPVGQRLALIALRDTLGKDIEADGPVMTRVDVEDDHLVVHFDHAAGLTTTDGNAPAGFWIADESQSWVQADAELKDEAVVLRSPELSKPLYVRYAFAGKPTVNLINAVGLPAVPFRTDRFQP
jgi:sialate O-acetylesterase